MATESLGHAMEGLFLTGKYSDLEVRCGSLAAKVHKNILCSQSDWFAKAIDDERFLEGHTGIVEIKEQDPDAVKAVLQFLYTGAWSCPAELSGQDGQLMLFHLDVYAVVDLIQHKVLKSKVESSFRAIVERGYEDALFPSVVQKTYEVSPPGAQGTVLRGIIIDTTARHASEIFDTHAEFEAIIEQVPAFGARLAAAISRLHQEPLWTHGRALKCPGCDETIYVSSSSSFTEECCPHNRDHRDDYYYELERVGPGAFPRMYQCLGPERHRFATLKEPELCYACNASVKLLPH